LEEEVFQKTIGAILLALSTVCLTALSSSPSTAATITSATQAPGLYWRPVTGVDLGNGTQKAQCFGKEGIFKQDSRILAVDWNYNGTTFDMDECFGIAPDRRIYHAWRNSVDWDPMPNGGLADDTYKFSYTEGYRTVHVWVAPVKAYYCSSVKGSWTPWKRCPA
jgi:hypothetical protein